MLQNSPTTVDQAKSGKNRIRTSGFLNQYSAPVRNLEKNFFARELKIVLQQEVKRTCTSLGVDHLGRE